MNKIKYIYMMKHYSTIKRDGIRRCAITQSNLENIYAEQKKPITKKHISFNSSESPEQQNL